MSGLLGQGSRATGLVGDVVDGRFLRQAIGGQESIIDIGGTPYHLHAFLGNGTFSLYRNVTACIMIQAGGGTGAKTYGDTDTGKGAGGAGGNISTGTGTAITAGAYTIVVGAGGVGSNSAGTASNNDHGANGSDSTGFGKTAKGGGGGGASDGTGPNNAGRPGGCGGGASSRGPGPHSAGASTQATAGSASGGDWTARGTAGGTGLNGNLGGAGGGGLQQPGVAVYPAGQGAVTSDGEYSRGGAGGKGHDFSYQYGSMYGEHGWLGGGGGGGSYGRMKWNNSSDPMNVGVVHRGLQAEGGMGGGGNGLYADESSFTGYCMMENYDGLPNTGGGGGGSGEDAGRTDFGGTNTSWGGSGIVLIRYACIEI